MEISGRRFSKETCRCPRNERTHGQAQAGARKQEAAALARFGYKNKHDLSKLDINSNDFIELSIKTNINPTRLKHLHDKSLAFQKDEILITKEYTDPGADLDYVVHFDIEANYDPDVRSGAYSFGVQIQSQKTIGEPVKEIVSVYRSPGYNKAVRGNRGSYHMSNQAIDVMFNKTSPWKVARAAKQMRNKKVFKGGIGRYRHFVHIDTRGVNADW